MTRRCGTCRHPKFNPLGKHWPLTPSTVEILGHNYSPRSTIWAGLKWHKATLSERNEMVGTPDHHLNVPWCHISDEWSFGECTYRVRPRYEGWRFVKAPNGNWVLQRAAGLAEVTG